jgi:hypothetical protein
MPNPPSCRWRYLDFSSSGVARYWARVSTFRPVTKVRRGCAGLSLEGVSRLQELDPVAAPTGPPNGGEAEEPPHQKVRSLSRPAPINGAILGGFRAGCRRFPSGFRVLERGGRGVFGAVFRRVRQLGFAPKVGRVLRLLLKERGGLGRTNWARRSRGLRTNTVRGHSASRAKSPTRRSRRCAVTDIREPTRS